MYIQGWGRLYSGCQLGCIFGGRIFDRRESLYIGGVLMGSYGKLKHYKKKGKKKNKFKAES